MENTSSGTKPAVALLIDGENANPSGLEAMWKKVGEAGDLRVKCLIGNFRAPPLAPWKDAEAKYGLAPIQATAHVAGKNTSDSRLIIEAMRLYYETDIRTFVIMSSDSDFTQLALFLREKGARVIGIGCDSVPWAWRSAVSDYWTFEPQKALRRTMRWRRRALRTKRLTSRNSFTKKHSGDGSEPSAPRITAPKAGR